jgi:hypothetical protein
MTDNRLAANGTLAEQPVLLADGAAAAFTQSEYTPSQPQLDEIMAEASAQQEYEASPGPILQSHDSMAEAPVEDSPGLPSPGFTCQPDAVTADPSPEGTVGILLTSQQVVVEGSIQASIEIPCDFHTPDPASFNGESEREQNDNADYGLIGAEIISVNGDSDSDEDDDLFVRQPGEVKVVNNIIDLTQETEAESDARALRVSLLPTDTEPPGAEDFETTVKQEEDDGFVSQDMDSDYKDESDDERPQRRPQKGQVAKRARRTADTDIPGDIEDSQDMLGMLSAEKHMLSRHHAKNTLKRGQAERLKEVRKTITALEKRIQELTATQAKTQPPAAQPGVERQSMAIAASPPSATRKRKAAAQTTPRMSKKQSSTLVVSTRGRNKGNAAKESTELILNLIQNQDVFAAGQAMADLPVFAEFDATTWKDQDKHFRDLASNGPGADKKKIQGDRIMLGRARTALSRKYKVMGEKYLIRGMKTHLYAYQFVATGWMVGKELSTEGPKGGILADSMDGPG